MSGETVNYSPEFGTRWWGSKCPARVLICGKSGALLPHVEEIRAGFCSWCGLEMVEREEG